MSENQADYARIMQKTDAEHTATYREPFGLAPATSVLSPAQQDAL